MVRAGANGRRVVPASPRTTFSRVTFSSSRVVVQFANLAAPLEGLPPLTLRVHRPPSTHDTSAPSVFDIPLNGEPSLAFDLSR